jgi:anti-sigma B factor antagonist
MTEELSIEVSTASVQYAVVHLAGFINLDTSEMLYEAMQDIFNANASRSLIFKVDEVEFVSSAGVGVFMSLYEQLEEEGGKVVFVGLSDSFRRVLDLLGFLSYFEDCKTIETAETICAN